MYKILGLTEEVNEIMKPIQNKRTVISKSDKEDI